MSFLFFTFAALSETLKCYKVDFFKTLNNRTLTYKNNSYGTN